MLVDYITHVPLRNYLLKKPPHHLGNTYKSYGYTGYMEGMEYSDLHGDDIVYSGIDINQKHFIAIKAYKLYRGEWYEHIIVMFQRHCNRDLIVNNGLDIGVMNDRMYQLVHDLLTIGECSDGKIKIHRRMYQFTEAYSDVTIVCSDIV